MKNNDSQKAKVFQKCCEVLLDGVFTAKKECCKREPSIKAIITALDGSCIAVKEILRPYVSESVLEEEAKNA